MKFNDADSGSVDVKEEHKVESLGMSQNLGKMIAKARIKLRKGSNGKHEMTRLWFWVETQMDFSPRRNFMEIQIERDDKYMHCDIVLGPLQTEGYA